MARPQRSEATPAVARARITGAHLLHSALFSISGSGRHPEAKGAPGRLGGERHTFPMIDMGTSRPLTLKPALLPYMAARVSFSGTLCPD